MMQASSCRTCKEVVVSKNSLKAGLAILLIGLFVLFHGGAVIAQGGEDAANTSKIAAAENGVYIEFEDYIPNSVHRIVTAPDGGADIDIFARDGFIRDDIVEIYVDGCLLATVNSINGESGTHEGETHTVSVGSGHHTVEYRNVQSGVGPSGWYVSETVKDFTGNYRCAACAPPDGSPPVMEWIDDYGTCGSQFWTWGTKNPSWGRFGKQPDKTLVADSGEQLEIQCGLIGEGLRAFLLIYTSPQGDRQALGICPFQAGCNSSYFWHSGDNNDNGQPDCFIKTRWISRDYHKNDIPNLWTGEQEENPALLDWADSLFHTNDNYVAKLDHKFNYKTAPPLPPDTCNSPDEPEGDWRRSMFVDPSIWPTSLSSAVAAESQMRPTSSEDENELMVSCPFAPCDLDADGDCDDADKDLFESSLGTCRGDPGYIFAADLDGDGCVAAHDDASVTQQMLQQMPQPVGGTTYAIASPSPTRRRMTVISLAGLALLMAGRMITIRKHNS